jgi:hypothetical protein
VLARLGKRIVAGTKVETIETEVAHA